MPEIKQYVDMDGLRKLLTLIRDTYVCQNGLTSAIREQVQDMISNVSTTSTVKEIVSNETDPAVIANLTGYSDWKNGDFLIAKNSNGNNSVFYYHNSSWITINKAPLDEIDASASDDYLKANTLTANAIINIIDEKIQNIEIGGGDGIPANVEIATHDTPGIVMPSSEDFEISTDNATKGLLKLKPVAIKRVTGLQEVLDSKANVADVYTKEEINTLLLTSHGTAESMATISVVNPNNLEEYKTSPVGTIANITGSDGSVISTYILTYVNGEKVWEELKAPAASVEDRLTNVEESNSWDTF